MSSSNSVLARRWFEGMWNERRPELIDQIMAPGCVGHHEGDQDSHGPEEFKAIQHGLLDAFPDLRFDVDGVVAEGEEAVVRWSAVGVHKGGGLGIPASGREARMHGMTWFRFQNGQIIEGWDSWNLNGMLQSLVV